MVWVEKAKKEKAERYDCCLREGQPPPMIMMENGEQVTGAGSSS